MIRRRLNNVSVVDGCTGCFTCTKVVSGTLTQSKEVEAEYHQVRSYTGQVVGVKGKVEMCGTGRRSPNRLLRVHQRLANRSFGQGQQFQINENHRLLAVQNRQVQVVVLAVVQVEEVRSLKEVK